MKVRWRLEPKLALVNGGASTLWHGTSKADPWDIYAAEFGGSPSQPWSETQSHVSVTLHTHSNSVISSSTQAGWP